MGIYQRGENWGIDWYDGFKRRRQLVGPSKGEAKSLLAVKRTEWLRGRRQIVPKVDVPTFVNTLKGHIPSTLEQINAVSITNSIA